MTMLAPLTVCKSVDELVDGKNQIVMVLQMREARHWQQFGFSMVNL